MTLMHGFASLPCFCSPSLSPSKTQFKRAELRPPRSALPAPPPGTSAAGADSQARSLRMRARAGLPSGRASVTQAARKPELRLSRQRARRAPSPSTPVFSLSYVSGLSDVQKTTFRFSALSRPPGFRVDGRLAQPSTAGQDRKGENSMSRSMRHFPQCSRSCCHPLS